MTAHPAPTPCPVRPGTNAAGGADPLDISLEEEEPDSDAPHIGAMAGKPRPAAGGLKAVGRPNWVDTIPAAAGPPAQFQGYGVGLTTHHRSADGVKYAVTRDSRAVAMLPRAAVETTASLVLASRCVPPLAACANARNAQPAIGPPLRLKLSRGCSDPSQTSYNQIGARAHPRAAGQPSAPLHVAAKPKVKQALAQPKPYSSAALRDRLARLSNAPPHSPASSRPRTSAPVGPPSSPGTPSRKDAQATTKSRRRRQVDPNGARYTNLVAISTEAEPPRSPSPRRPKGRTSKPVQRKRITPAVSHPPAVPRVPQVEMMSGFSTDQQRDTFLKAPRREEQIARPTLGLPHLVCHATRQLLGWDHNQLLCDSRRAHDATVSV